ncbi:MAG: glycosyltransferase [Dehalococcoidales bacterium]|nr:glycosyltransferase [Dehalococcoidales bacterium]
MTRFERQPHISVVIPAYNEEKFLPQCLESLRNQDYAGDYEIIVVDNASTDNTAKVALAAGAKVVYESKRSPAWARQRGLEEAKGDIVAFIDADSQAPSCWLSTLVSRFAREPKTVVISGPCAFLDAGMIARFASYLGNFITISLEHLFRRVFNKGGALWGSNFAARRSVLLAAGGFDTSLKFYGEDYELSLRLKNKGRAGIIPWLFVRTSARRLKELGLLTTCWNYIVDYFSVLFWDKPIPERLEDWPRKAWQGVVASCSWQRLRWSIKYLVLLLCLLWLHTSPIVEGFRRLLYGIEIAAMGTLLIYYGINPASQLYGKVCSNGNRNHRYIALTFDDGPNEPYTSQVLNILRQYRVKATFFFIGQNVQRHPEVCQRVLAEGNVIGNHSYHHYKLLWLRWGKAAVREIDLARQAIYEATGCQPELFRPPHGFRTPWLMHTIRRLGYTVVTWDNMTDDWKAEKPAEEIVEAIVKRARSGSIIVLHDGRGTRQSYDRSQMLQALPQIIEELRKGGFDFVTVPELIQKKATASAR